MLIGLKMLLVFALLGGTLWFLRRHDRSALTTARRAERPVALLAQAKVGKTASVALVRIAGETYAVGVTEQSVRLLLDSPVEMPEPAETPTASAVEGASRTARIARSAPPATLGAALRSLLGRRSRVEYLDVDLPVQSTARDRDARNGIVHDLSTGTDGSGSSRSARRPEPTYRR